MSDAIPVDQANAESDGNGNTPDSPPPPPVPASDPVLGHSAGPSLDRNDVPSPRLASLSDDLFDINPLAALHLLGAGIEALVRITGDIPPSPPSAGESASATTHMRGLQDERDTMVRTLSAKSLARLREEAEAQDARKRMKTEENAGGQTDGAHDGAKDNDNDGSREVGTPSSVRSRMPPTPPPARPLEMEIDGVHLRTASPSRAPHDGAAAASAPPEPYTIIGANSQPLNMQHSAITRKFYSKKAPPIPISEYLMRLHRFCPMSTGVYLATSLYIHRLAVAEKAIAVTRRNAHRLLLAGLRVAMKALEDQSYSHAKVARVGGVSEAELARLEINFCFLAGFELSVRADEMRRHWVLMKNGKAVGPLDQDGTASAVAAMVNLQRQH